MNGAHYYGGAVDASTYLGVKEAGLFSRGAAALRDMWHGAAPAAEQATAQLAHGATPQASQAAQASHVMFPGSPNYPSADQMAQLRNMKSPAAAVPAAGKPYLGAAAAPAGRPYLGAAASPAPRSNPANNVMFPGSANQPTPEQMAQLRAMKIGMAVPPPPSAARGLLHDLATPALGGAVLGGTAGAIAADEGQRTRGALYGAGLGAVGAAGGTLAGKAYNASQIAKPTGAYEAALRKAIAPAAGEAAHDVDPALLQLARGDKARDFAASPEGSKLWDAVKSMQEEAPTHERGAGMLGGVLGTGAGMALTPPGQRPAPSKPEAMSYFEDPYQYQFSQ